MDRAQKSTLSPEEAGAHERGLALRAAAKGQEPGWAEICTEAALDDPHAFVRAEGARAIGAAPDEIVIPLLAAALSAPTPAPRFRATRLLVRRDPARAMGILEGELTSEDRERRHRAAEALGRLGRAALPALRSLAAHPEPGLRARAARGLAATGELEAAAALAEMLGAAEPRVRLAALRGLSRLATWPGRGEAAAAQAPKVAELLRAETDPEVFSAGLVAASSLGVPFADEHAMAAAIEGDTGAVAVAAMELLARSGKHRVLAELACSKEGSRWRARVAACALASAACPVDALVALLGSRDPAVRQAGARGLSAALDRAGATAALRAAIHDDDDGVRWVVRRGLAGGFDAETADLHRRRPPASGVSASWPFGLPPPEGHEAGGERYPLAVAVVNMSYSLNLGVLIRSAEAAGAREFLIAGRDFYNRLAAMGTDAWVELQAFETHREMAAYARAAGYQIVAVQQSPGAERFDEADYPPRPCIALGAEGQGLPPDLCAEADLVVEIPQRGRIDSLNVGSAGAIVLWTCLAQRGWL